MSNEEARACHTQHAFLVIWGRFAQEIGLVKRIEAVKLKQKTYWHSPQTKVLEFFVATLVNFRASMYHLFSARMHHSFSATMYHRFSARCTTRLRRENSFEKWLTTSSLTHG